MKSNNAKERIEEFVQAGNVFACMGLGYHAIEIAEEEAEDRFLNELKTFLSEKDGDPITEATFLDFKRYLEEESDEH